jgi:hypothetical protein
MCLVSEWFSTFKCPVYRCSLYCFIPLVKVSFNSLAIFFALFNITNIKKASGIWMFAVQASCKVIACVLKCAQIPTKFFKFCEI